MLAIEPYYGGSHRAVLDSLIENVDAEWTLVRLPARKWKWRMRGSAITMAADVRRLAAGSTESRGVDGEDPDADWVARQWDVLFCSTFLGLAEFRGLVGPAVSAIPAIVYFHENQLVYPNRHEAEWDYQFPLTNITTALSAERCIFNTAWNRARFLEEIVPFLQRFPDHIPEGVSEAIDAKSSVLPPPFDPAPFDAVIGEDMTGVVRGDRPRLVWPHRWEHDKNPEEFFSAVTELADDGLDFEVAVAGQRFREQPEAFERAQEHLGDRLVHIGEPGSREEYGRLLASSDIAVSTAHNEFFGLSMIEAAYAGCFPLVPDRLCYPELYPDEMRYDSAGGLAQSLRSTLLSRPLPGAARRLAEQYTITRLAPEYESVVASVALERDRVGRPR